ncbi:CIS tube protein [Methylobacter sp. YRD-M1]|uniref:CIS tube protein n=1 Tax=Methylobacter sp. YRD-M1 TaxID=2911520 RepID=UPI00227C2DBE|nr:LysM peptidoglycan-binding domain-containing protein [Methylobacter sp. YRD-M1]WAK03984.1 LysM peptidoglycan-binding domain-containing protein [Methylobacter sp. YRD-M1]
MALEKMLILAFETAQDAESGGRAEAKAEFEALINPESYTLDYKVKTADSQGQGTSAAQSRFEYTLPEELSFEFLFDNTGIIDDKPKPDGIFDDVNRFRQMLTAYQGDSHEPYHLKLVWGNLLFKGRAVELGISYKLFNPDGQPIRAIAKAKFKGSIEEKKRALKENKSSPDLSHIRKVKAGDNLPQMCYRIYGDPKYYLQIAQINGLHNFRHLVPGMGLIFPPLAKTDKTL